MSKQRGSKKHGTPARKSGTLAISGVVLAGVVASGAIWYSQRAVEKARTKANTIPAPIAPLQTNEVAQSIMVTVELDFGPKPPRVAEAIKEIERRSDPASGTQRTFAILDADGWVTASNRLHMQMHLSMEQPGTGALIFRRTGEVLWQSRIVAAPTGPPAPKRLTILMADTAGKSVMLDGSKGAARVLDVPIDKSTMLVRDLWPDGAEHEFTFIYSVCGCPVKAKVRRMGETTARTTELPVMFPDDPAALETISALMGWTRR
jgi:hypothetical protein